MKVASLFTGAARNVKSTVETILLLKTYLSCFFLSCHLRCSFKNFLAELLCPESPLTQSTITIYKNRTTYMNTNRNLMLSFHATETGISSGLVSHLAHMQILPMPVFYDD